MWCKAWFGVSGPHSHSQHLCQHLAAEKCREGAELAPSSWFMCSQNRLDSQGEDEGWSRSCGNRAQGSLWPCQCSLPGCSCLHTERGIGIPYPSRIQGHTSHGQHWLLWVAPGWRCPCTVVGIAQVLQQELNHGWSEHQACTFPFPGALSVSSGPELSAAEEMEGERDRPGR